MNIKEKLKSKVSIFGRPVSVFMIMFVLLASIGTAATLASYGTITGTATVQQSVILSGEGCWAGDDNDCEYTIANSPMYGDSVHMSNEFTLTNRANVPVSVSLVSSISGVSDGTSLGCPTEGGTWLMEDGVANIRYFIGETEITEPIEIPAEDSIAITIETTFANACSGTYAIVMNANTVTALN